MPTSVRDRPSPTKKEKLWCKVCLHPPSIAGRDASSRKRALVAFFLS